MTTKKAPAKKPKHISKTKQELRRLREFAGRFLVDSDSPSLAVTGGWMVTGMGLVILREEANWALTGKVGDYLQDARGLEAKLARIVSQAKEIR